MHPSIYLNNAATSWPKAPGVVDAVASALRDPVAEHGRSTLEAGWSDPVISAREALSAYLGAVDPTHVVLTSGATDALNMLIHGFFKRVHLSSSARPHVISTTLEHNAILRPLRTLESGGWIDLTLLPFHDGYIRPGDVSEAIQSHTKLCAMTHGSNVLGTTQDIRSIGHICADNGVFFLVDGAQTAGVIPPDLSREPIDAYAFTGHKYLLGPAGTGGFWLREPDAIVPVRQGGTGSDSANPNMPTEMPDRFEAGTLNYPGLAGLSAALGYIFDTRQEVIQRRLHDTTSRLAGGLLEIPGVILHQDAPDLPVIAFSIEGVGCDDAGFLLQRAFGVIARTGLHCAPLVHEVIDGGKGCIRLSPSLFTTEEECDTTISAVEEVASHGS